MLPFSPFTTLVNHPVLIPKGWPYYGTGGYFTISRAFGTGDTHTFPEMVPQKRGFSRNGALGSGITWVRTREKGVSGDF